MEGWIVADSTGLRQQLKKAVIEGRIDDATALARDLATGGAEPLEIIDLMQQGLERVGILFENGACFLPEMYASARAVSLATEVLKPHLAAAAVARGRVVLATVKADIHDIGKNIVRMMLEASGYEVVDLGVDVASDEIVARARETKAGLIALSSLMTISMSEMARVVDMVSGSDLAGKVKVIVGGAPISQSFADRIGADGYGKNARDAVLLANRLIGNVGCAS